MENQLAKSEASLDCVPDFVLCRPAKSNWVGIIFFWLFGLFYLISPVLLTLFADKPGETPLGAAVLFVTVGLASLCGAIGGTRWMRHGGIIADAEKICWRGVGKARMARWEDVSDYYLPANSTSTTFAIETPSGTVKFGASSLANASELAVFIREHARNAKATEWQKKGARAVDPWPRRFTYKTFENRWGTPLMGVLAFCVPLLATGGALLDNRLQHDGIVGFYGLPMAVLYYFVLNSVFGFLPLMSCMMLQSWRGARRRRSERIEATPDGIQWSNGAQTIDVTWDEVRALSTRSGRGLDFQYVVETARGDFSFTRQLGGYERLQRTISTHAIHAQRTSWHCDGLSNEPPLERNGAQIYHYRTRTTRLVLWAATIFALMPVALPLLRNYVEQSVDDFQPETLWWGPTILLLIGVAAARRYYYASNIRVDEHGIAQVTLQGERFLSWERIENYSRNLNTGNSIIEGHDAAGQKVRLSFSESIAGYRDLRDEIEKRATHSINRTWPDQALHALPPRAIAPPPSEGERGTLNDW